jgi:hypothetical protein
VEYKRLKQKFDHVHRKLKSEARMGQLSPSLLERCIALDEQLGRQNPSWRTRAFLAQAALQNVLEGTVYAVKSDNES